jgi:hypothetical protein
LTFDPIAATLGLTFFAVLDLEGWLNFAQPLNAITLSKERVAVACRFCHVQCRQCHAFPAAGPLRRADGFNPKRIEAKCQFRQPSDGWQFLHPPSFFTWPP